MKPSVTHLIRLNKQRLFLFALPSFFLLLSQTAQATVLGFESNDFTDWLTSGNTSIKDSSYGSIPTEGIYHALLETGAGSTDVFSPFLDSLEGQNVVNGFLFSGDSISAYGTSQGLFYTQGSAIKKQTQIEVTSGKIITLSFDYNFLTNENPTTGNNDLAFFSLNEQLIPITSVKTANLISSTLTPFNSSTGYQLNQVYTITKPGTYTLGFGVLDERDFATPSGLLVDNIRIESADAEIIASIPEPSSLLGLGLFGLLLSGLTRR
ncbi:PEP-CTERM sorting domain-containing protein [Crocosphaera sp. XPORK-15E]|uniref:PEP-CTERM sorting domain-containing protein n=1 Tax=Crocosphaera sp. XPORK-15E TaxID=3110247 RepID=UPI002B1F3FAB|nr:PEP-CTERM sorting domain-containing protein [Crocosphaera sp. XPORK-15E]MEA5534012.1 PEP-CTERM sorting domain-containing protein [Crocosphaera sp. XPORK-15E]